MAIELLGIQLSNHEFSIKRTGHARFRRGPSLASSSSDSHAPSTSTQSAPVCLQNPDTSHTTTYSSSSSRSTNSSSLLSPFGIGKEEETVSNGKQFSVLGIVAPTPAFSSRKPPLPASHRKRCRSDRPSQSLNGSGSRSSSCHCCKRRKTTSKREIRRVPITGSKVTSIPADDYSWKKYGEKKIDGSINPRVYYTCNTGKGCPARKSVELAINDSKMLIITYDGEHNHVRRGHVPSPILTGLTEESK